MEKNKEQLELEKMRHSCEHVLHQAVTDLFPGLKRAMGPATDEGFYHDFDYDGKVSEEDFPRIEKRMQELIDKDSPIVREEISIEDAKKLFKDNPYKLDWIRIIEEKGEKATVYWTGKPREKGSDVDLCKGPHVESTGKIGPFKLLKIAGAYWHGDEKNKMLQRIYGTAYPTQKELDDYLNMIEEAKKRDHKKLGKELGLFTFSELVGAGLPLWTPKGTLLRNILDNFVWELRQAKGYQKVTIPHITKKDLYETSGHWAKFSNDLFKITTREGHEFAMKPMNCPHHTQIYACEPRSYRDLPHRYAETTMVYRDEQTGELSGLSRVRCITQDDAHCFCRESQLKDEFYAIWDIIETFYARCGFPELKIRLSLSDPEHMEKYLGTREDWDKFEEQLRGFIRDRGAEFTEAAGEAAFYGPKIDFMAKDSLGREWQVATIQADRNMPKNFKLFCTNEDGKEEQVVMIHAAIMGSIERFLSILIEHHAGAFPFWMAPVQAKILPISDKFMDYANKVAKELKTAGMRIEIDISAEGLGKKIRNAEMQKVPYMVVVGEKEQEAGTIAVRDYATKKQEVMAASEFLKKAK
ncbi:MAG: threonyl-tRNA synthetase, threonyl-tRNA synthetase [Candidatus Peregrinibacteria bacterium GW2011_GWF2_38_29]|nr:MAG: threonyl-tRNA synthetase, threonyl-tRNA synthetase [Candidatus Peregrinibacteria bacterium GW2011_GWF2_38_29]HBB02309.1 threonine--tRNA ligase [Candidatus Peregrinibacteria bacterium]